MRTLKIGEMHKVNKKVLEEVICIYSDCPKEQKGVYLNCYLHTYVRCPIFNNWYSNRYIPKPKHL